MKNRKSKRLTYRLVLQLCSLMLVLALCLSYFWNAPDSASWLHTEDFSHSNFEIGDIKFRFYDDNDTQAIAALAVNVIAPTRYFIPDDPEDTEGIDANFNMVARSHAVTGTNQGTVDMNVDLSYTESIPEPWKIYYLFVPIDNSANYLTNYQNKRYRQYLDTALAGMPVATPQERVASMRELNDLNIAKIKNLRVQKQQSRTLFYILVWAEYDTIDWLQKRNLDYVRVETLPLVLYARTYQENMPT